MFELPVLVIYSLIGTGMTAVVGLIAWLAYLGVCMFIVAKTGETSGLRDLGHAATGYRKIMWREPKPQVEPNKVEDKPGDPTSSGG